MADTSQIISQIDEFVADLEQARHRSQYPDELSDLKHELTTLVVRAQGIIDRNVLRNSTYAQFADSARTKADWQRLPDLLAVLLALKSDLERDYYVTVVELLHAETFADFLEMATELFDKGFKDPSAVLAGSVLESHLRAMADKFATPTINGGRPMKADTLNAGLVKAGVYNVLQQKQVTADLAIRNAAAHGKYDEYTAEQVRSMLGNVRQFILKFPA